MKEIILQFIKNQFVGHLSSCKFPEEKCTCKNILDVNCNTELIRGGYIDSFSMVRVLVFLEKKFKVDIPDWDATPENFNTVNKMVNLVKKYK